MKIGDNSSTPVSTTRVQQDPVDTQSSRQIAQETFSAIMELEPYKRGRANDLATGGVHITPELVKTLEESCASLAPDSLIDTTPSTGQIIKPTADNAFEVARDDLHQMKDAFGGSPNFAERKPVREPNTRSFLGIPFEAGQTWASKGLKNASHSPMHFLLLPVYKLAAKYFGVNEPQTKYEYVSKHLESMAYLKANPNIIQSFKDGTDATAMLGEAAALTCHASANGAFTVGKALEDHMDLLDKYIAHNKAQGPEALKAFYSEAFDDGAVCVEARLTHFNEYVASHPLDGSKPQPLTIQLDLERVPLTRVLEQDFGNFVAERTAAGLSGETPKISEFETYLKKTYGESGLLGKNCVDESQSVKGPDDTFSEVVLKPIQQPDIDGAYDYFVDVLCCADDDRVKSNWQSV